MVHQTKEQLAAATLSQARQAIKYAQDTMGEMDQHKGGYKDAYKAELNTKYKDNIKLAQQLLHYTIDNITGMTNVSSNPTNQKLKDLGIIISEPEPGGE